ncbi:MAG: protease inhibitor I9 family protein, partial [Anaerolineae bacterium]
MSRLCRIMGMILVFSLLTSADVPVLASLQRGRLGLSHLQRKAGWEAMPAALSPLWQPSAPGVPGPVGGVEQEMPPVGPIEPELLRVLLDAESSENDDETVRVIVYLREQADLDAAASDALNVTDARARIVSALQAQAARSQAPLRAYLEGARAAGLVDSYTPFWIFDGIAVRARPSLIRALVAHPTVATVRLDHWRQWITDESPNLQISNPQFLNSPEWGITRIRADQVWASLR